MGHTASTREDAPRRTQGTPVRVGARRRLPLHGDRELHALIELAYDAASDASRWPMLLQGLAEVLGCELVGMNFQRLDGGPAMLQCQIGGDPSWTARYEEYYAPRNIFIRARPDLTFSGAIRNGEAIVPDSEAMRTEYFNDFLRPLGVLHAIGMVPFRTGSVIALLSLMRRIGASSYAEVDLELLGRFMPHLQRALAIHRRLESVDLAQAAASEALDGMAVGVVILDGSGKALFLNRYARTLVDAGDGLVLGRGGLAAARPDESATLGRLVADACGTGLGRGAGAGGSLAVTRPSGRRALTVLVAPLRARSGGFVGATPAAVVFIGDPERTVDGIGDVLHRLYGLTRAEARVATLLLEGRRTEDLAERLGITVLTARTHVKRILAKVDVRNQTELVRVLLGGPAGLRLGAR